MPGLDRAGALISAAGQFLAQIIRGGANATQQALANLVQSLSSQLLPSPWGGFVGSILGAFLNRGGGRATPVEVVNEPVVHFADYLTYGYAMNPATAALGNRLLLTGAGATPGGQVVEISFKGEAGELLEGKLAARLYGDNYGLDGGGG